MFCLYMDVEEKVGKEKVVLNKREYIPVNVDNGGRVYVLNESENIKDKLFIQNY